MRFHDNLTNLAESGVLIGRRVEDFLRLNPSKTLIRLDQKLMNMPLPAAVTNAMKSAVDETVSPFGSTLESPRAGYDFLKNEICARYAKWGVRALPEEIFITAGLESAYDALSSLFAPENDVLLPDPCRRSLLYSQRYAGRGISFLRATPENDFSALLPEEGADIIFLASPDPVTGVIMTRERAAEWVDFARRHDSLILFDASLFAYVGEDGGFRSVYEIEGAADCAIELISFEHAYGVRELKIASCFIPASLTRAGQNVAALFSMRQRFASSSPSYVLQKAAQAILSDPAKDEIETILYRIRKVAAALSRGLFDAGIPHVGGTHAPYLWAQCPFGLNAWQTFDFFLEKAGVVVTPGSLFGTGGERYFRLTAFGLPEEAAEAGEHIAAAMKEPPSPQTDPQGGTL